jgi:hypothetical protein
MASRDFSSIFYSQIPFLLYVARAKDIINCLFPRSLFNCEINVYCGEAFSLLGQVGSQLARINYRRVHKRFSCCKPACFVSTGPSGWPRLTAHHNVCSKPPVKGAENPTPLVIGANPIAKDAAPRGCECLGAGDYIGSGCPSNFSPSQFSNSVLILLNRLSQDGNSKAPYHSLRCAPPTGTSLHLNGDRETRCQSHSAS